MTWKKYANFSRRPKPIFSPPATGTVPASVLSERLIFLKTGFIFKPAKSKEVSKQIAKNPKVEICAFKDGKWLRLSGELCDDDRREARVSMLEAYPELCSMYDPDDGNTQVLYFKNAKAVFSSFTEAPKTVEF